MTRRQLSRRPPILSSLGRENPSPIQFPKRDGAGPALVAERPRVFSRSGRTPRSHDRPVSFSSLAFQVQLGKLELVIWRGIGCRGRDDEHVACDPATSMSAHREVPVPAALLSCRGPRLVKITSLNVMWLVNGLVFVPIHAEPRVGQPAVGQVRERHAGVGIGPAVRRAHAAMAERPRRGDAAQAADRLGGAAQVRARARGAWACPCSRRRGRP